MKSNYQDRKINLLKYYNYAIKKNIFREEQELCLIFENELEKMCEAKTSSSLLNLLEHIKFVLEQKTKRLLNSKMKNSKNILLSIIKISCMVYELFLIIAIEKKFFFKNYDILDVEEYQSIKFNSKSSFKYPYLKILNEKNNISHIARCSLTNLDVWRRIEDSSYESCYLNDKSFSFIKFEETISFLSEKILKHSENFIQKHLDEIEYNFNEPVAID